MPTDEFARKRHFADLLQVIVCIEEFQCRRFPGLCLEDVKDDGNKKKLEFDRPHKDGQNKYKNK